MLNLITKSKIRKRIILLFVYNPRDSFYINQIARLVKTSAGNVQRELKKLEVGSLLTKEKKGNSLYFKINTASPLFEDFKNIVDKTIGLKNILEETLKKAKDIDFAFLFGSAAPPFPFIIFSTASLLILILCLKIYFATNIF